MLQVGLYKIFNFSHLDPADGVESAIWVCFVDKRMGKSVLGWVAAGEMYLEGQKTPLKGHQQEAFSLFPA